MGYRINERNSGSWSLASEPKQRRAKGVTLRGEMKDNTAQILQKVYECMERDEAAGGFTDGGRFTLLLDRHEMAVLQETIEKLNATNNAD